MYTIHEKATGRTVAGLLLILIGTLFLVGNVLNINVMRVTGPLVVLGLGVIFFVGMVAGGKATGGLAIPGSMFVILGLMLVVQSILPDALSWAYAWALFAPLGVGVGLLIFSWWSTKPELKRPGYILIMLGLILFFAFGMFFETIFGMSGSRLSGSLVLALGLIGLGLLLLFGRIARWGDLLDRLPPHFSETLLTQPVDDDLPESLVGPVEPR